MNILYRIWPRAIGKGSALLIGVGLIISSPACYPGDEVGVEDLDVVLTIHDEDAPFSAYRTFVMPDTVIHEVSDSAHIDDIIPLPREYDDLILDLAESNMTALGYTREMDPAQNGADLVLLVSAIGTSETSYWVYYDWWYYWGWWPGWGPYSAGLGAGTSYYYPPGYVGSVTVDQGTVILTLLDPNDGASIPESIPLVWSGAIRGLLYGGSSESRITSGINQAFSQSPYLGAGAGIGQSQSP